MKYVIGLLIMLVAPFWARAANTAEPVGDPFLERPTLRCLGAYWIVRGDDNKNAVVTLEYRKADEAAWHAGGTLFRVEKGVNKYGPKVPDDAWLFAGSALLLEPQTRYELKLTLNDPDGGPASKTLAAQTVAEPVAPQGPIHYVVPGDGGGTGSKSNPYQGIAAADKKAKPGD